MSNENTISRRGFLEAVAALGSLGLASCAGNERQASRFFGGEPNRWEAPCSQVNSWCAMPTW